MLKKVLNREIERGEEGDLVKLFKGQNIVFLNFTIFYLSSAGGLPKSEALIAGIHTKSLDKALL